RLAIAVLVERVVHLRRADAGPRPRRHLGRAAAAAVRAVARASTCSGPRSRAGSGARPGAGAGVAGPGVVAVVLAVAALGELGLVLGEVLGQRVVVTVDLVARGVTGGVERVEHPLEVDVEATVDPVLARVLDSFLGVVVQ